MNTATNTDSKVTLALPTLAMTALAKTATHGAALGKRSVAEVGLAVLEVQRTSFPAPVSMA